MKKTLSILIIALLISVLVITPSLATTSFTIVLSSSPTTVEQGKTIDVTVSLKNFTPNETGVNVVRFTVDYDKTIFETLKAEDIKSKSNWSAPTFNPTTGEAVVDNGAFMAEDHEMVVITFKAKANAVVGNTTITIKDVNAADAQNDIFPSPQSITLTVNKATEVNNVVKNNTTTNNTNTATKNPKTGIEDYTVPAILGISALALLGYARYRRIK